MKNMMKAAVLAAAATVVLGASAMAEGTLKFATNPEFPPFEYVTTEGVIGEYDGIDMAIAAKIGEVLEMDVTMDALEFDSLIIALQNGQIDAVIAGMTVTDERKEAVNFTAPYYKATQVMIVKGDSEIAKATDMADKKICVIQGYTGETVVHDMGYEYVSFKKGPEAIMELKNGKCDVVVIDSATASNYVKDNPELKIVEDPDAFESEEYAIAINKKNEELLAQVDEAIAKMLEDGTIGEIITQYEDAAAEEAEEETEA